ncbi:MAG: hypothetical protein LUH05_04190 [Candidatus Gastranaerophilales bacterium]|nr:hypothetical protein [Candidatus Gastranaerophilales bacterium]
MEKKLSVSEFAELAGTTAKTIYQRILNNSELPENEQLNTVKEKIKGREVTVIITDYQQIELYKNLYGKEPVNNLQYEDILTDNNISDTEINGNIQVKNNNNNDFDNDIVDKILTINDKYNNRLELVYNELKTANNELAEVKSKQLLLEDKASREGLYLNEINTLKKDYNKLSNINKLLITVIILLLTVIIIAITYFITVNYISKNVNNELKTVIENVENK